MTLFSSIFYVIILIFSVVIHEVAHGFAALKNGDETALRLGRLTLNPIKHLDPVGSVILPLLMVLSGTGFVFGWAKPVPYNPNNLRNIRKGTLAVASAGILVNICVAVVAGLFIRFLNINDGGSPLFIILQAIVLINIVLAVFNLIPIPPLDGSSILFSLLPQKYEYYKRQLEQYSFIFIIVFVFFLWKFIYPVVWVLYTIIVGK